MDDDHHYTREYVEALETTVTELTLKILSLESQLRNPPSSPAFYVRAAL